MQLFLSHSTRDRSIAEALKLLIEQVFGKVNVEVEFSSDQEAGGGIPPGAQWLPWVTERIRRADKTYALLTPNSMTRPWVLWESGAAAGVALATNRSSSVVPITFGIRDADIPHPLLAAQRVRGDTEDADGITRLLQDLNDSLGKPLNPELLHLATQQCLPDFLVAVTASLNSSSPIESLIATVPHNFSVNVLGGHWLTGYGFASAGGRLKHADIAELTPESDRRMRAKNYPPEPRTDGHALSFRNET